MDVDLIERCRTRDPHAFAGFVALWGDAALRVATVVTGEPGRARAAVRTALLTAWRDFPSLHSERPIRPWLLGMVARAAAGPGDPADQRVAAIVRARNDSHAEGAVRALLEAAPEVHLTQTFFDDELASRLEDTSAIDVRRLIGAAPDDVWEALASPGAVAAWAGLSGARIRPGGSLQRGSRFAGIGRLAERRSARIDAIVTRAERPVVLAWSSRVRLSALPRALEMRQAIELHAHRDGSEVRSRLLGVALPGGTTGRILGNAYRRIEPAMHGSMLRAIERLAGLVERRAHKE